MRGFGVWFRDTWRGRETLESGDVFLASSSLTYPLVAVGGVGLSEVGFSSNEERFPEDTNWP